MKTLIENSPNDVLLRGITKSTTKERLISKLNSNDSLYDGLFLVGDKAKNFLEKSKDIPHPIKTISSIGQETVAWIFDMYSSLQKAPIDLTFFRGTENKQLFIDNVKDNEQLIDYYLFGLHTHNSDSLVNFVSATALPKVAFNNQINDKLVIFLWIPNDYNLYINSRKLQEQKSLVESKKLPILLESFHPSENEYSFKGFILPHLIIGIHDLEENDFIFNPALLISNSTWIEQGLDIDQSNFESFIKGTRYQRFLTLTDKLEEKNVF